jgi:uncharacterized protein (DUF2235 family)
MISRHRTYSSRLNNYSLSAYELYADLRNDVDDSFNMADHFKKTFARDGVRVHFLGAWYVTFPQTVHASLIVLDRDTVSSVGIIREKSLPGTNEYDQTICYFRHALALDERRVKFLPEYICGGDSYQTEQGNGKVGPDVKEVWFAGCHSDMFVCLAVARILHY